MCHEPSFLEIIATLSRDFLVSDVVLPTSTCIFVLESPHLQEVEHKIPVAGRSGVTMAKHLFEGHHHGLPLGLMMKENTHDRFPETVSRRLNGIGLINVCNVPLQQAPYANQDVHTDDALEWLNAMAYIRTNYHRRQFRDKRHIEIQNTLIRNFRIKLQQFHHREVTFIPCGRFAEQYFQSADIHDRHWKVIRNVPHPSYNSWDRAKYREQITAVKDAVAKAAAASPP